MSKRHDKIGIKQIIQKHWMDYIVSLMLAGLSEKEIRKELDEYLAIEKPYVGETPKTHAFIKSMLSAWFAPDKDLVPFRNRALTQIRNEKIEDWMPYHWAVISASYPFWFNVAKQTGRLFNLQNQITSKQISVRLCEYYGERESVWHYAKYVIRSFVAWGILQDSTEKGCYEKYKPLKTIDNNIFMLLLESALYASKEKQVSLLTLKNDPALFPFQLPSITGDYILNNNEAIDVIRYGFNDELLKLKYNC